MDKQAREAKLSEVSSLLKHGMESGVLSVESRAALLDALDAVPREHRYCHWEHEAQRYAGNADYWRDRAERAERERDAHERNFQRVAADLRSVYADNDRLREALSVMDEFVIAAYVEADEGWWEEYNTARAALSADADADAEPGLCSKCDGAGAIPSGAAKGTLWNCTRCHGTGEYPPPSMRKADAEPDCSDHKHSRSGGRTHQCSRCGRYTFPPEPSRAGGFHHDYGCTHDPCECSGEPSRAEGVCWACHYGAEDPERWQDRHTCGGQVPVDRTGLSRVFHRSDAEGGRPREADPQTVSTLRDDGSVDGGGDDDAETVDADCAAADHPNVVTHHRYPERGSCACGETMYDSPPDDGYVRAVRAAAEAEPVAPAASTLNEEVAAKAIDAALASGGVRLTDPGEPNVSVEAYWAVTDERDKAEARADRLRLALERIQRTYWSPQDVIRAALREDDDA